MFFAGCHHKNGSSRDCQDFQVRPHQRLAYGALDFAKTPVQLLSLSTSEVGNSGQGWWKETGRVGRFRVVCKLQRVFDETTATYCCER